jgi:uncharacterized iron-regulated membrane protein
VIYSHWGKEMSFWQRWLGHPEHLLVRKVFFHIHLWVGIAVSLYILVMSVSGSIIVYRDWLEATFPLNSVEWLVNLHENLLVGDTGRLLSGAGAICVTVLCLTGAVIWWPGINDWRRGLAVNWKSPFARLNWDLHSALGFWCFFFVLLWGVSGFYFAFPQIFNALFGVLDPGDKFTDKTLLWLSLLHFGRFGWFAEALWALLGLVPALLSVTGVFLSCHRCHEMLHKRSPNRTTGPTSNSRLDSS